MADPQYIRFLRENQEALEKLAKANKDYADSLEASPTGPTGATGPTGTLPVPQWPKDLSANPTGPKKSLPAQINSWTSSSAGQVVDGLNVNGVIVIKHDNVTIRNFKVMGVNNLDGDKLTLEDGVIDGKKTVENGINDGGVTVRRVEITNVIDGIKAAGNTLVEDSWLHDMHFTGSSHGDGLQVSSGSNVTVRRTRGERSRGTAFFFGKPDFGAVSNLLAEENYVEDWGNFVYQMAAKGTAKPDKVTIRNNIFGRQPAYIKDVLGWTGEFYKSLDATNVVWSGNKKTDGTPIP